MSDMYNLLEQLCHGKGVNITQMSREAKIPRSVFSELKAGRTKCLSNKYLPLLAEYFGVSVDYLLGNEKEPATDSDGLTEADRRDIAIELEQLMAEIEQSGDLMFDGDPATPEAMESLRNAMEMGLIYAKKINKEKLGK